MLPTRNSLPNRLCMCLFLYILAIFPLRIVESKEITHSGENRRDNEREMLVELQDVLQKLQRKRVSMWELKLNQVPRCTIREPCAVKRGARIGKLCECPVRTSCNFYFLRCL
ncbi:cocaine- and amphetamine-regulated transcript protein-like [Pelobates fuscus]|uniref:cocaine- and amphetamine-regulated transcript protein-like n=1 Tax=Pelobates fuscus TaxID=191477 RepID=UPI002FE4AF43